MQKPVSVLLKGGLGNQMFQFAFARAYVDTHKVAVKLDCRYLNDRSWRPRFTFRKYDLDLFEVEFPIVEDQKYWRSEIYFRLALQQFITKLPTRIRERLPLAVESGFHYDENLLKRQSASSFVGYFQSYKYFCGIKKELVNNFKLKKQYRADGLPLLSEIKNTNSICLNVRRTDFLDSRMGVPTKRYYKNAIDSISRKIKDPRFYIFSDDTQWCTDNFKNLKNKMVVGHEFAGVRFSKYFDLMSSCRHFIIPNSTFAWWAAYLSEDKPKVVIAPKGWHRYLGDAGHKDIVPIDWETIDLA